MLTGVPPTDHASTAPAPRRRVWPWAAGSILITLAIIITTLVGQRLALRARLASQVAPAPALPPLAVSAIMRTPGQITQLTLDQRAHTLVAQVQGSQCPAPTPQQPQCDTGGAPMDGVLFYDSQTGALRGQSITPTTSAGDMRVLVDATHGATYVVTPTAVTIFSDATGKQVGKYASALGAHLPNARAIALDGELGLIYTVDGSGALSAFIAANGQLALTAPPPSGPLFYPVIGPELLVDANAGRIYLFNGDAMGPALLAYNASDLAPLGGWRLNGRQGELGPLDAATHTLYLGTSQINLARLPADGAGEVVYATQTVQDATLKGASHFGVDSKTGALALVNDAGIEALASDASQPYAQTPLTPVVAPAPSTVPWLLPVDSSAGLAYLPGDNNTILIVSLAQPTSHAAPNALTAALIARAGIAKLLPDTNQSPAFVSAPMFPLGAGTVQRRFFIHYSDLGWKGPYPGTASIGDVKAGAAAGDYTMTFTVTWNQLFLHQHSWTLEVTPDGATHLRADVGDGLP